VLYSARDDHRGVITIINFCLEREILNEKGSFRNETVGHMPSIGALLSQVDKGTLHWLQWKVNHGLGSTFLHLSLSSLVPGAIVEGVLLHQQGCGPHSPSNWPLGM
jgi:hypothetical protein